MARDRDDERDDDLDDRGPRGGDDRERDDDRPSRRRDRDDDDDRPSRRRRGSRDDYDDGGPPRNIPNNMAIAIMSIFCCWPVAIGAIVNAAKVNRLAAQGDYREAQAAADKAKQLAIVGIVLGLVGGLIRAGIYFAVEMNNAGN